jgi:hypothetical protein
MESERAMFGNVAGNDGSDRKLFLLIVPVVLLVMGAIAWALVQGARASGAERAVAGSRQQVEELQKQVAEKEKLLSHAVKDESILRSPGQATALFFGVGEKATESGVALADPDQRTVRIYLYGLVAPPQGQEYVVAARAGDGAPRPIGSLSVTPAGSAFLLARDLPQGTNAIQVMLRPAGQDSLEGATPRVSARYPVTEEDRGILMQPEAQARRGARR